MYLQQQSNGRGAMRTRMAKGVRTAPVLMPLQPCACGGQGRVPNTVTGLSHHSPGKPLVERLCGGEWPTPPGRCPPVGSLKERTWGGRHGAGVWGSGEGAELLTSPRADTAQGLVLLFKTLRSWTVVGGRAGPITASPRLCCHGKEGGLWDPSRTQMAELTLAGPIIFGNVYEEHPSGLRPR